MMNDLAIVSLDTITCYGLTGEYLFTMDELQSASINNTQEKVDITGKGGRKLNSLKRNKAVTVSGTNGLLSGGLLELQTGGAFAENDAAPILWTEYVVVNGDKATTEYAAVGTAGAEITALYVKNAGNGISKILEQAESAAEGKFAYASSTKELTFAADEIEDGTEIVVQYMRNVAGNVLENMSESYSKKCQMYIDATAEDQCSNQYHVQFYIPRADFSGDFDVALGDNQTVHAFEAESLSGGCGGGKSLWTYTVFGATAA